MKKDKERVINEVMMITKGEVTGKGRHSGMKYDPDSLLPRLRPLRWGNGKKRKETRGK